MRDHRRAMLGVLLVLALVLLAGGLLGKQSIANAQNNGTPQNSGTTWASVTVLYLSDTRGKIEPCG
jgi:hypothetical protein